MSQPGRWTAEEDASLKAALLAGKSKCAIARQLGRSESSVYTRAEVLATKATRTVRHCMCCRQPFMSDGAHNRLCCGCRAKSKTPFDF